MLCINRIVTHRGLIVPVAMRQMGHMNVMWYVGKFDEATWQLTMGLTLGSCANSSGNGRRPPGTELSARVTRGGPHHYFFAYPRSQEMVIRFTHEMRNTETDEIAATTTLTGVCIDEQLRKSCPFPPALLERIRAFMNGRRQATKTVGLCGGGRGERQSKSGLLRLHPTRFPFLSRRERAANPCRQGFAACRFV